LCARDENPEIRGSLRRIRQTGVCRCRQAYPTKVVSEFGERRTILERVPIERPPFGVVFLLVLCARDENTGIKGWRKTNNLKMLFVDDRRRLLLSKQA